MTNKKNIVFVFIFIILSAFINSAPDEFIKLFKSDITVNIDASITVKETIVYSFSDLVKRGIFRDIPTVYSDKFGNNYVTNLKVLKVLKDGHPTKYKVENLYNGKRLVIADLKVNISPGDHIYTVEYEMGRALGFFNNNNHNNYDYYDELYFSVPGVGWSLPIYKVKVYVNLPIKVPKSKVSFEGYTGYMGSKDQNYRAFINSKGQVVFETTQILLPKQTLDIVVDWPAGFVHRPTTIEKIFYFFSDNMSLIWLIIGLIILTVFYIINYLRFKKDQNLGTVIPLFEPPKDLLPSEVSYLVNLGFSAKAFASEIVNMAVNGLIKIELQKGWFSSVYILKKQNNTDNIDNSSLDDKKSTKDLVHGFLMRAFFKDKNINKNTSQAKEIKIDRSNQFIISSAVNKLKQYFSTLLAHKYFDFYTEVTVYGVILSCLFFFISYWFSSFIFYNLFYFILVLAYLFEILFFNYILKGYTPEGKKLMEKIKGFKLFLSVTETNRFKIIGTPPTKTPELFEKYLPYAIALGVEQEWSKQFEPVFKKFESIENNKNNKDQYYTKWFSGAPINYMNLSGFSSNLSNSLSKTISSSYVSSSSVPPGTYSGSKGRGSAGGGAGGGGGGSI